MFEQSYICNKDYVDIKGNIIFVKGNIYTGYTDNMGFLHILVDSEDIEIQDSDVFSLTKGVLK